MANPSYRSSSSAADQTGATFSVTKPTGAADGDLLVAFEVSYGNGGVVAPPSGWTESGTFVSMDGGDVKLQSFYKVVASDGASYTFNNQEGGAPLSSVYIVCVQGPPAATPEGGSRTNGTGGTRGIVIEHGGAALGFGWDGMPVTGGVAL